MFAIIAAIMVAAPLSLVYSLNKPVDVLVKDGNGFCYVHGNMTVSDWCIVTHPIAVTSFITESGGNAHNQSSITFAIDLGIVHRVSSNVLSFDTLVTVSGYLNPNLRPSGMKLTVIQLSTFNGSNITTSGMAEGGSPHAGNNTMDNLTFENLVVMSPRSFYFQISFENYPSRYLLFGGYNVSNYLFDYKMFNIHTLYGVPLTGTHAFEYSLSVLGLSRPAYDNITFEINVGGDL